MCWPTGSDRVIGGGRNWYGQHHRLVCTWVCRSANRFRYDPDNRNNNLGFEVLLARGQ
ncbi:MAG TPA: hypothetical protein PKK57_04945 [Verrucomicrobiota bacterium]|nr:hypothetical protein [Verrucomicrobiota bacterium]